MMTSVDGKQRCVDAVVGGGGGGGGGGFLWLVNKKERGVQSSKYCFE